MNEDSIFAGALEKASGEQRAAFLDGACAGDDALRARVEALLAAHEKPDSLLDDRLVPVPETESGDSPMLECPGMQIGRYKLLQKIGEGGFGVVYMAEQEEPVHRRVALKIIKPGMDSRAVVARFEAERQALAMMDHPNIAKVLDAGTTNVGRSLRERNGSRSEPPTLIDPGRPFFVMELVHGIPITKFCDDQRLSPRERLALFIPVCHAIQHAHQKGIIHRDVKPSNILVCLYDGVPVPKVIDFGVAKAIQQKLTKKTMFTQFGQVIGTLEYMSPEQAEMNQLDIDTRSDVYSLGTVLYELLTGTTPFEPKRLRSAAFDEMLRIIREEEPPRPSLRLSTTEELASISAQRQTDPARLTRLVKGELDWIVMKALDKQRSRRYETANGLAKDIERYLEGDAVEASPPSAGYRVRKFAHRYRKPLAVAATILVLLSAATAFSSVHWMRADRAAAKEKSARLEADGARTVAEERRQEALRAQKNALASEQAALRAEETTRIQLHSSRMRDVWREYENNNIARVKELLEIYESPAAGEKDLRGWDWYYWNRMCHLDLRTLTGHEGAVTQVAFNPDSSLVASGGADGTIRLWRVASGEHVRTIEAHEGYVTAIVFHPDGERLISGGNDRSVVVWNVRTRDEPKRLPFPYEVSCLAVSASGELLAAGPLNGRHRFVWELETSEVVHELPQEGGVKSICFTNDDTNLICAGVPDVEVWDVATGTLDETREGHRERSESNLYYRRMNGAMLSPDAKALVTFGDDRWIKTWDAGSHEQRTRVRGHDADIICGAFHPDGEEFATGSDDNAIKIWDVENGEELRALRGHTAAVEDIAYSPDGTKIASASEDGTVKIWDANQRMDIRYLVLSGGSHYMDIGFSSDGRAIAVGSIMGRADGTGRWVTVVDSATHELVDQYSGHQGMVVATKIHVGRNRMATLSQNIVTGAREVKVARLPSGDFLYTLKGGRGIQISPDGELLVLSEHDHNVFDMDTGDLLHVIPKACAPVAFRADGGLLALPTSDKRIVLVDPQSGETVHSISVEGIPYGLHFSPDGRYLGVNVDRVGVLIWDLASVTEASEIRRIQRAWGFLGFDGTGSRFFSKSNDSLTVYHRETGDLLCTLKFLQEGDAGAPVAVSPNAIQIAIGNRQCVSVLDIREETPEIRIHREAQALVAHLLRFPLMDDDAITQTKREIVTRVQELRSISEPVRDRALSLIDQVYTVEEECDQHTSAALSILDRPEEVGEVTDDELRQAVEWARHAYDLHPERAAKSYGLAQFRLGNYQEALPLCEKAVDIYRNLDERMVPIPECLLAMTQHHLGQRDLARITLARAKAPQGFLDAWKDTPAVAQWRVEATRLIAPNDEGERLLRLAFRSASNEEFEPAVDQLRKAKPLLVGNMRVVCLLNLAQLHLATGRYEEHKQVCAELAEDFDVMNDYAAAFALSVASAPRPNAIDDWPNLVEASKHHDFRPFLRGAVLYRAGAYSQVIETLEKRSGYWELAFLCMAYAQLDELEQAKPVYQRFKERCEADQFPTWHHKADTLVLLEEAKQLIEMKLKQAGNELESN